MSVAIAIILDTRRVKDNNKYPVKLRVNHQRVTEYFQTIFDLTKEEYEKLPAPRITAELQAVKTKLRQIERDTEVALKEISPFSFEEFEKKFVRTNPLLRQRKRKREPIAKNGDDLDLAPFHKKFPVLLETNSEPGTLIWSYKEYIKKLLREGRISTAVNYHCSYVSLKKFRGNVPFAAITTSYLFSYEQKMKEEGASKSTIGFYLRPLRAVYNEAVEAGLAKKDKAYPFGKKRYQIPSSRNVKKALELSDVEKIYYYNESLLSESEKRARDYWLFSYFGNGMNPKDIAFLKYKDIHDDFLVFERSKTERSMRADPKPISVFINDDMKAIIERWGNKPAQPNSYIFPILLEGATPLRQYALVQNVVGVINDCMKRILKELNINKKATTYVARHTFSTILKKSGASTEQIQEALGHTDVKTTENYLDSFDKETKKRLAGSLVSFKKKS